VKVALRKALILGAIPFFGLLAGLAEAQAAKLDGDGKEIVVLMPQQRIGSPNQPVAYVWWPADNQAGIATLRRLSRTGAPVFQVNQAAPPEAKKLVVAYAGVDDYFNGQVGGKNLLAARDAGFDNASVYKAMSQLIPSLRGKGIDFVYGGSDGPVTG
jgi:ribose transport system substrate-binding protein